MDSLTSRTIQNVLQINPSWSVVVLTMFISIVFLLYKLSNNTKLTEQILKHIKEK